MSLKEFIYPRINCEQQVLDKRMRIIIWILDMKSIDNNRSWSNIISPLPCETVKAIDHRSMPTAISTQWPPACLTSASGRGDLDSNSAAISSISLNKYSRHPVKIAFSSQHRRHASPTILSTGQVRPGAFQEAGFVLNFVSLSPAAPWSLSEFVATTRHSYLAPSFTYGSPLHNLERSSLL